MAVGEFPQIKGNQKRYDDQTLTNDLDQKKLTH